MRFRIGKARQSRRSSAAGLARRENRKTGVGLAWSKDMQAHGSHETEMAERMIIMAANLHCGTMMGIEKPSPVPGVVMGIYISERPITTLPHWDVLSCG